MADNLQQTVVLVKPDGVKRALVGAIIARFERAGFKMIACKMIWVDKTLVAKHYANDKKYLRGVGEKTLADYKKYGLDPGEQLGTKDPLEIGKLVRKWNMDFISAGPVVAMIWEGPNAIEQIRKIVGHTFPSTAQPGTIRGDFSIDNTYMSNTLKRSVKNLIHASGDAKEAEFEIKLWFKEDEIYKNYKRVDEDLIYGELI